MIRLENDNFFGNAIAADVFGLGRDRHFGAGALPDRGDA